jgi:hypothetical protein
MTKLWLCKANKPGNTDLWYLNITKLWCFQQIDNHQRGPNNYLLILMGK